MDRFVSHYLHLDAEGRVGHKLQIWEFGRFGAALAEATAKARTFRQQPGTLTAAATPLGAREE